MSVEENHVKVLTEQLEKSDKITFKQLSDALDCSVGLIVSQTNLISRILLNLRGRNELNKANYDDLTLNRIELNDYFDRTNSDFERIATMSDEIKSSLELLSSGTKLVERVREKVSEAAASEIEAVNTEEYIDEVYYENVVSELDNSHVDHARIPKYFKCTRGCSFCEDKWKQIKSSGSQEDHWDFCFNVCSWCNNIRKSSVKSTKKNITPVSSSVCQQEINIKPTPLDVLMSMQFDVDGDIDTNDKYFEVTLTAEPEDGSFQYLCNILDKNFKQMFPPSYRAKAWVYGIVRHENGTVFLHGLIRYDSNNKFNISTKATHLKNNIMSHDTKIKHERKFFVSNLTKYMLKRYVTSKSEIFYKYGSIIKNEITAGNTIELFF